MSFIRYAQVQDKLLLDFTYLKTEGVYYGELSNDFSFSQSISFKSYTLLGLR